MICAKNAPDAADSQDQRRTADIIAFERVKALRPGVHDYDPQLYADLLRVGEMAHHNTEAQKTEDAERRKNDPPGSLGAAKVPQPDGDEAPRPIKRIEPTDDQIADIFAEEHRHDLRYVAAWGKWFEWTGKLWREDLTLRHFDLVRRTCKAQGVKRAGMAKLVNAVQTLARADRRIAATIEQWDANRCS
jgi:D5 N terminal like